ncbi:MAG: PQQ-binding-like beta-propeller repeat protein [Phycisphaerales bacterium JB065]
MATRTREAKSSKHGLLLTALIGVAAGAAPLATAQTVNEEFKLTASDGHADDNFGKAVAIDAGRVVIGSPFNDKAGTDTGTVYVYNALTGSEIVKFRASDAAPNDTLGHSVAIDGTLVAAGAMNADSILYSNSGAAYLFDVTTGNQLFKFTPDTPVPGGQFGNAIALDGGVVAVGAHYYGVSGSQPGYVYLFDATTGTQSRVLTASDGANEDQFGWSVDIADGLVVVGAPRDDDNGNNSGSVYVFDASTGTQLWKLTASDGAAQDRFGWSVAIHNDLIAVGSYLHDANASNAGAVYLYDAQTGAELTKITSPSPAANDWFGFDVALDDDILVALSGKSPVYTFDLNSGVALEELAGSDSVSGDSFGYTAAVWEGIAVVGALYDDDNGTDSGSAYVFDVSCRADLNGDGFLDTSDVTIFLDLYDDGDPMADWNHDGSIDYFDVQAFISDVNAGCPHS